MDISGGGADSNNDEKTYDELCEIVIQQKARINELEGQIKMKASDN